MSVASRYLYSTRCSVLYVEMAPAQAPAQAPAETPLEEVLLDHHTVEVDQLIEKPSEGTLVAMRRFIVSGIITAWIAVTSMFRTSGHTKLNEEKEDESVSLVVEKANETSVKDYSDEAIFCDPPLQPTVLKLQNTVEAAAS